LRRPRRISIVVLAELNAPSRTAAIVAQPRIEIDSTDPVRAARSGRLLEVPDLQSLQGLS
jgi:hypothetical protein